MDSSLHECLINAGVTESVISTLEDEKVYIYIDCIYAIYVDLLPCRVSSIMNCNALRRTKTYSMFVIRRPYFIM